LALTPVRRWKLRRRLTGIAIVSNALGAGVAIFYFTRLRAPVLVATDDVARITANSVAISILVVIGIAIVARWRLRSAVAWAESAAPDATPSAELQRQAIEVPLTCAEVTFWGWVVAGLAAATNVALHASLANPDWSRIGQILVGVIGIIGPLTAILVYLAAERVWRPYLPRFFPKDEIVYAGAFRLKIRWRLIILFLVSAAPVVVLAMLSYDLAIEIANSADPSQLLPGLLRMDLLIVSVSVFVAIAIARSVATSVIEPLELLQRKLVEVRDGNLDTRVPVTSNDELGVLAYGFNAMVNGLRQEEVIRELFSRYVTREVAEHAIQFGAAPGGELIDASVLFADIRGFTTLTEASAPATLIEMLNRYFRLASSVVVAHGGMVNKYGGDSILAVFGTPLNPADDHAERAFAAAVDLPEALARFNADQIKRSEPQIEIGIGIATGPILAGNVGSEDRLEYTVIGDAVNVASRLQAMTRELDATILVADATARVVSDRRTLEEIGQLAVRGKLEPVTVYAVRR
jgi:class 3 adenylate cyclase